MMTNEANRAQAAGRAAMWGLLSRLFDDEPDEETIRRLAEDADGLLKVLEAIGAPAEDVAAIAERSRTALEDDRIALRAEYTGLFEAHKRIYPFASCWMPDEKPRVLGPRAFKAQGFYAEAGVGLSEERLFRADHVGTEMAFLSTVAGRAANAEDQASFDRAMDLYVRFLQEAVLAWMPQFFQRVASDPRASFFASVARVAAAFLKADAADLGIADDQ